jgi:poly(3-hydroxybutyrate) depolymerase
MRGRTTVLLVIALAANAPPARAQFRNRADVDRLNRRLAGRVVDYTHNHGADRRVYSPALGMPRDFYVYLPPGYDPQRFAYPILVYMHMGYVDEHTFSGSRRVVELDRMIQRGEFPPTVVVAADGTQGGENRINSVHTFFLNSCAGPFQDYVVNELLPFVMSRYSIRPEREAHALMGVSAGGLGAINLALKRRDLFGSVALLAAPLNLRYGSDRHAGYFANFDPATYRPARQYDPDAVVGRFFLGLQRARASKYLGPVFGCEPDVMAAITRENPADLLAATDLKPCELNIYANYPGRDSYNFDAQAESFAWLAAQRGVRVTLESAPLAAHGLLYFIHNHRPAFRWLGRHLAPPAPAANYSNF